VAGAAIDARQRWDRCRPADAAHPYLKSKGIDPCGTRVDGDKLLVPMRDIDGKLWSLQEIAPDGFKHNQEGGRRKGCFFQIGEIGETFCIAEGFSTCGSIHMATGLGVVSAGEAGNLERVAKALREKYPHATMVICGDDDWLGKIVKGRTINVGKTAAKKAAEAVGGALALPRFGPARPPWATDFNDMAKLSGLDEVATRIKLDLVKFGEDQEKARATEPPPPNGPEDYGLSGPDNAASLAEMNEIHAAVSIGGKFRVMTCVPHPTYPLQRVPIFATKTDFLNHVVEPKISVPKGDSTVLKPRGKWWIEHRRRRQFDDIDFVPGKPSTLEVRDGRRIIQKLNMFSGFSVVRAKGSCQLYLDHVHDHVCMGNEELYQYTLSWMASGVQHPGNPARTALSMRGKPGSGKGVFATEYGKIFGRHFLHLTNREHVVGKFNAHSAESCLGP
jgi:hypothetical protein